MFRKLIDVIIQNVDNLRKAKNKIKTLVHIERRIAKRLNGNEKRKYDHVDKEKQF
jgi:hypothetical protein